MRTTCRRSIASSLTVVLAAAGVLVAASHAVAAEPRDIREHACPPNSVGPSPYVDTTEADTAFAFEIACMTEAGVVQGNDGRFRPGLSLTRGQVASLLERLHFVGATARPAIAYRDAFTDDNGSVHEEAINWAAATGVVTGYPDGNFRPTAPIRRDQFASMTVRLDALDGHDLPPGSDAFSDDDGSVHEDAINRLAAGGVIAGTGGGAFSPAADVTRAQGSAVLARLADLQVENGRLWPLPANQVFSVDPAGPVFREQSLSGEPDAGPTQIELRVGDLEPGQRYRAVVTVPEDVDGQPPATGPVRFADRNGDGKADLRVPDARIVAVNSAPLADGPQAETVLVADADGHATVTVDNEQANGAVFIVHPAEAAGQPDAGLAVDDRGQALEPFGVSGDLTWFFRAAPAAARNDALVDRR